MEESLSFGENKIDMELNNEDGGQNKHGLAAADLSDPFQMNGLVLAYIGDAVFELLVRKHMIDCGIRHAEQLHKNTVRLVNAAAQSEMILGVMDELKEDERAVFRRGRNSNTATAAKNQKISDYRRATGLEAVFGYLYLEGRPERIAELFEKCLAAAKMDTDVNG